MKYPLESNYFHCYATANDERLYYKDIRNLLRLKSTNPGVGKIYLFVAISEVNKINILDLLFVRTLKKLFLNHPIIELKNVLFKSNVGRDFSSYKCLNELVQKIAAPDDYVFFQNRSGFGPFKEEWLKEMINEYEGSDNVAICGSTINFKDHPAISQRIDLPHVQTYAFLIKTSFLKMLGNDFPGHKEVCRIKIISQGEIGLSQFFIKKGYAIICMEWPGIVINNDSQPIVEKDVKNYVTKNHQFYHRFYCKNPKNDLKRKLKELFWCLQFYIHLIKFDSRRLN